MADERRREPREAKRIMLTFVKVGETKVTRGIAINVSRSGLLVAVGTVFPKGTRLMVTEADDPTKTAREFEVRNSHRLGDGSAMGLRAVVGGKAAAVTGSYPLSALKDPETPAALPATLPGTAGPIPAEAPVEEPTSSEQGTVFTMRFETLEAYRQTYQRDFKRGGAFVQAAALPEQDQIVLLEIIPPMPGASRLLAEAKVVFRGGGGFGVEFLDRAKVLATLPA